MRLIDADALMKDVRENSESYFADDFAEFWVNRQPTIQPEPHLIPCSERLPKIEEGHTSKPCLVYCKIGEDEGWNYAYGFAELEENIFGQVGWNCERDDEYHEPLGEVIAWMPLPEEYRGE